MKRLAVVLPAMWVLAAALARPKIEFPDAPETATRGETDVCARGIVPGRATRIPQASSEPSAAASTIPTTLDLDELSHHAFQAFNTQWYSSAERLCRAVLEVSPQDSRALDMLARIPAARLDRLLYLKHSRGRLEMDSEVLNDLSPGEWDELVPRLVAEAAHSTGEGYPTVAAVHWALDTLKIDFAFDGWKLDPILRYIRDYSGINLLVSAAVQDRVALDEPLTLHLSDLPLREALRLLAQQVDPRLGIVVTDEKIVLISDPQQAQATAASILSDGGRDALGFLGTDEVWGIEKVTVDLDLLNAPMSYIVEVLRQQTGIDFRLVDDSEEMISLKVSSVSLRTALALLLRPRNLDYVREGSIITIGHRQHPIP